MAEFFQASGKLTEENLKEAVLVSGATFVEMTESEKGFVVMVAGGRLSVNLFSE